MPIRIEEANPGRIISAQRKGGKVLEAADIVLEGDLVQDEGLRLR